MSRGLTFWNDETIKLIKENFVAASVPTWLCRAKTPEGEFLRSAGIDKQWVTSSGYMSCISASGKRLGYHPCPAVLEEFRKLPEAERKPGAVQVADLKPAEQIIPAPPEGGLVLRVHARFLSRGEDGKLRHAKPSDFALMRDKPAVMKSWELFLQPNTEYLWLTKEEWQSLVPADLRKGQRLPVNPAIVERMARFHLTPQRATTSEGGIVAKKSVKAARLALVVEEVTPQQLRMRLEGFVHWGSDYDEAKATSPNGPLAQGFETPLHGRLEYDRMKKAITRLDLVAPGDVWGAGETPTARACPRNVRARNPFGFAFELATGSSPTDRIPPGGNGHYVSELAGYFTSSGSR